MSTIAVCLVTLPTPERQPLLHEAIESVYNQTRQPDDMVVGLDYSRLGEVKNNNRLLRATDSDFIAFLHDDDIYLPEHLATAEKYFDDYDVIVSRVVLEGRPQHSIEPQHGSFDDLRWTNWFPPSAVVVRRSVFKEWDVPPNPPPLDWVDWSNWRRLLAVGARFVHTNEATFRYRFGAWTNGSWRQ